MGTLETRERIVRGAEQVFAELGIVEPTVQHVLESAGVSRRTFYQYFSNKEEVMAAVYDARTDELIAALGRGMTLAEDPVQKVVGGLDAWLAFQQEAGSHWLAMQADAVRADSLLHKHRERTLDAIVGTIDDAVQKVLGVRVDPLVFRGLAMGVEGIVLHLSEHGRLAHERPRLRRVAAALFLSVLASAKDLPDPPRDRA